MEIDIKKSFPLYTGKRVPDTWWHKRTYPKTEEDFRNWSEILIEWSEDPRNIRLPSFAAHLRFTWQRMYEWTAQDGTGRWYEALQLAKENIGRNREALIGVEGGLHQSVYNRTAFVFDDYSYKHFLEDRRMQAEESAKAAGNQGAIIKVVLPDLCGQ